MASPASAPTTGELHHLQLQDPVYAETAGGRFYALRSYRGGVWTLVDRDGEFVQTTFDSVEDCDRRLNYWVAVPA